MPESVYIAGDLDDTLLDGYEASILETQWRVWIRNRKTARGKRNVDIGLNTYSTIGWVSSIVD